MATLLSGATGNWTAAGTWYLCDSTSENDSEAGATATTTSMVASTAFTPGAITINAIAFKVSSRLGTATGTLSVDLYDNTAVAVVAGTPVTVNAVDIPVGGGWMVFPTTTGNITLVAGHTYSVRCSSSVTGTVTFFRATGSNWARQLRTSTTQAPAAGDKIIVAGEKTGAGTSNSFTVTMDSTATTSYGAVAMLQSISVSANGTLSYGTAASTNYYLRYAGIFRINDGGTFNIGTSGTPIPSTSTAVLEMNCTANVDSGVVVNPGGTFNTYGATLTYDRAFLAANAGAGATSLTTDVSTGWVNGDQIALAPTERTLNQYESTNLTADASGTTLAVNALSFAHNGTGATAGEVMNLTRNVKIRGVTRLLSGYIVLNSSSIVNCNWTEFTALGSQTAGKRGIDVAVTTGSATFNRCSLHEFSNAGSATPIGFAFATANYNNVTISNCLIYGLTNASSVGISITTTSPSTNLTINNCWLTGCGSGLSTVEGAVSITNCRISSTTSNTTNAYNFSGGTNPTKLTGTISNNVAHTCGIGFSIVGVYEGSMSGLSAWFTTGAAGITISNTNYLAITSSNVLFGNATTGLSVGDNRNLYLSDFTINSNATYTQPSGIRLAGSNPGGLCNNFVFANLTTFTLGCIEYTQPIADMVFSNSLFNGTELYTLGSWNHGSIYSSQDHNQTAGNHKQVRWAGTLARDAVIFRTLPCLRMTPGQTAIKLRSSDFVQTVSSGATGSMNVWIRRSVVGDGTAYNGNAPRLVVRKNPAAGFNSDTVLATSSGPAGTWEQLSGTTGAVSESTILSYYVDCDGTQGWVNADDAQTSNVDSGGMDVWANGVTYVTGAGPASNWTDPGIANVRSGVTYQYNSAVPNRTGTLVVPATSNVKIGVTFDNGSTGTYDGSDRWTDPGTANVRLSTAYKANSVTNNRTGTLDLPAVSNVRLGVVFDNTLQTGTVRVLPVGQVKIGVAYDASDSLTGTYDGSDRWTDPGTANVRLSTAYKANSLSNNRTGTLDLPAVSDVRLGVVYDNTTKTGTVRVPAIGLVKIGYAYDASDSLTGTYDGSDRWTDPGTTNVRTGTNYKANSVTNNRTGTLDLPSVDDVRLGVIFDNTTKTGTVRVPTIGQVKIGVAYDANDSLTGTYDGSDRWTDPGIANVRLSTAYKANSLTNNRTGTLDLPSVNDVRLGVVFDNTTKTGTVRVLPVSQVKVGVVYDANDSLTGTYDGSDRWTDPGDSNVRVSVAYKANSLTNNKTGRVTVPVAADVRAGVFFETDALTDGLLNLPSVDDVRLGVQFDNATKTGTARIPPIGQVKIGVNYDSNDSLAGTYDGSDRWTDPGIANVRSSVAYKANSLVNNRTGTLDLPSIDDVRLGVVFDNTTKTGTVRVLPVGQVKIGVVYDSNDHLTGTYDGSDRWTDPGTANVRLGTNYKANSTSNNRTGTLDLPSIDDVRLSVVYDNTTKTGTARIPPVGQIKIGVVYDSNDHLTGTYDGSDRWTDPGDDNVRLGVSYKANSLSNNKTGRITVPTAGQVKINTSFETDAATVGTYDGSDRWTDPGDNNVRHPVAYKANSLTNNKTGRIYVPVAANVKIATQFEVDNASVGIYDGADRWTALSDFDVRGGINYKLNSPINNEVGALYLPAAGDVKIGVPFDVGGIQTGTYNGSDRWTDPGVNNVRESVTYKANSPTINSTGNIHMPLVSQVQAGVTFDSLNSLTGTYGEAVPPTFAGIATLTALLNGGLTAAWAAATDPSGPISYEVFIQAHTSTGLFTTIPFTTQGLTLTMLSMPNGDLLTANTTYYVGVRATDRWGNTDTNTVVLHETSSGVSEGATQYNAHGTFSISGANRLEGTLWATANGNVLNTLLGAASYVVYDVHGNPTGISESGLTPDTNGLYHISPVSAGALLDLTHYIIEITINIDSKDYTTNKGIRLGE